MIHFHKYEIISSQQGVGTATSSLTLEKREGVPMTSILYQCKKCGKFKTKNLEGRWDIDKLNKMVKAI